MADLPVIVDSHLRLPDYFLERGDLVATICDELTIRNTAKELAQRQKRYGWWDLPDEFYLYDNDGGGDELILPRGYALQLKLLLREHGHRVQWIDRRLGRRGKPFKWRKPFTPRVHQPLAVKMMRRHQQGIYQAPTGSGKSLSVIKFIHDVSPEKTIIYVDKTDLFRQWLKDLGNWLGPENVGQVGAGAWIDDKRITVAMVQTVWSKIKREEIPDDFFDRDDCMILDECHHVTAHTIQHIAGNHNSKWRIGVSATPDKQDDKFEIALNVLGEVFHEDDERELRQRGVLIRPHVEVVYTNFDFAYWPDHEAEYDDDDKLYHCLKPKCKLKGKPHGHRNNYQQLKDALVSDWRRNAKIADTIWKYVNTGPHHHLVITDEVRHIEAIYTTLLERHPHTSGLPPLYVLTGQVTGKRRKALIDEIQQQHASVILATVAKEGLDIPVVDRTYLPFPSANAKSTQQKVGRGTRIAEGKKDSIVIDFVDILVPKLSKQFRNRRYGCYDKLDMAVIM